MTIPMDSPISMTVQNEVSPFKLCVFKVGDKNSGLFKSLNTIWINKHDKHNVQMDGKNEITNCYVIWHINLLYKMDKFAILQRIPVSSKLLLIAFLS